MTIAVDVEAVVAGVHRCHVSHDDVGAGDGHSVHAGLGGKIQTLGIRNAFGPAEKDRTVNGTFPSFASVRRSPTA